MKTTILLFIISTVCFLNAGASVVTVPGNFNSIQEAIDGASMGDTIVVAPGTYYENINFRGKNVMVTSLYYMAADTAYIINTIINGSSPIHPDTGSCVIFNSFEDSTAVLQGFTITGGTGTKWLDIHGAGLNREGGGILVELSSPTIRYNIITLNSVTDISGVASTGGGGIRVGDGNPDISNNVISNNEARYGAGIVLNYTGCKIRNNIIASNTGGQDFYGGSAIWISNGLAGTSKVIENNTLVNNYSAASNGTGGISVWSAPNVVIKNCIIYNNWPTVQIKTISSVPQVSSSNVQGGFTGVGNIFSDPLFSADRYLLQQSSPCIDSGDQNAEYEDPEDSSSPGNALFPSEGTITNDMGAYGGPGARLFPQFSVPVGSIEIVSQQVAFYPNPASITNFVDLANDLIDATVRIYDNTGKVIFSRGNMTGNRVAIDTQNYAAGIYFVTIHQEQQLVASGKMVVKH